MRPFIEKQYFSRFKNSLSWTLCNCRFLAIDENNCNKKISEIRCVWNLRMMRSHKWKDRWGTNEEDEWILWKPCLKSVLVSSIKILFSFSIISFPLPSAIIDRASKTYFLGIKSFVTEIQNKLWEILWEEFLIHGKRQRGLECSLGAKSWFLWWHQFFLQRQFYFSTFCRYILTFCLVY